MENSKLQDTSQVAKKNVIVMIIAILVFAVFLTINILRYIELNTFEPVVIFLDVMFLFVIFQRSQPKFITELDKRGFRITKISLFGKKVYDIKGRVVPSVNVYKDVKIIYLIDDDGLSKDHPDINRIAVHKSKIKSLT